MGNVWSAVRLQAKSLWRAFRSAQMYPACLWSCAPGHNGVRASLVYKVGRTLRVLIPTQTEATPVETVHSHMICLANLRGKLRRRRVGKVRNREAISKPVLWATFPSLVQPPLSPVPIVCAFAQNGPCDSSHLIGQRDHDNIAVSRAGSSVSQSARRKGFVPSASPQIGRREASCGVDIHFLAY